MSLENIDRLFKLKFRAGALDLFLEGPIKKGVADEMSEEYNSLEGTYQFCSRGNLFYREGVSVIEAVFQSIEEAEEFIERSLGDSETHGDGGRLLREKLECARDRVDFAAEMGLDVALIYDEDDPYASSVEITKMRSMYRWGIFELNDLHHFLLGYFYAKKTMEQGQ